MLLRSERHDENCEGRRFNSCFFAAMRIIAHQQSLFDLLLIHFYKLIQRVVKQGYFDLKTQRPCLSVTADFKIVQVS